MSEPFDPEYRIGFHKEDDDEDFSDIWNTNRGRGKRDKSTVWGTDEYFERYDKPRDEWDTGLEDYPGMTRRIKREREIRKNAERITENARRISNNAKRFENKIKIDAEKIRENARRAAENVRSKIEQQKLDAQRDALRNYNFTPTPRIKKTKRRFKLSSKSGGIGIFGIIFWGFLIFNMCSDDDSDTTAKVVDTTTDNEVVQQVKEGIDNLKPEVQALINKAKNEFGKVTVKDGKSTVTYHKEKPSDNSDPYKQPDDRYGSVDDKW